MHNPIFQVIHQNQMQMRNIRGMLGEGPDLIVPREVPTFRRKRVACYKIRLYYHRSSMYVPIGSSLIRKERLARFQKSVQMPNLDKYTPIEIQSIPKYNTVIKFDELCGMDGGTLTLRLIVIAKTKTFKN